MIANGRTQPDFNPGDCYPDPFLAVHVELSALALKPEFATVMSQLADEGS